MSIIPVVIPEPRTMDFRGERNISGLKIAVSAENELFTEMQYGFDALRKAFEALGSELSFSNAGSETEENSYSIRLLVGEIPGVDSLEGYILDMGPLGAIIKGISAAGCFYGIQTLIQIINQHRGTVIPLVGIKDWPLLKIRGAHLDLRTQMYTMDYLREMVDTYSLYKINLINLEYCDKFPFDGKHSLLAHESAFTEAQLREFIRYCEGHFIEIMPLLQCLGHSDHILKHPEYAWLKEKPDNDHEFCPMNPGTMELFTDLFEQMSSYHKKSRYFHIGGDETTGIGSCERCALNAAKIGVGAHYRQHIQRVYGFVKNAGYVPVLYGDIACMYPENVKELDRDLVFADWDYWTGSDVPEKAIVWGREGVSMGQFAGLSENVLREYREYFVDKDGRFKAFPYTRYLTDQGFKVITHSTARCYGDSLWYPNYHRHAPNIYFFNKYSGIYGTEGTIITNWSIRYCHHETTLYGMILGAEGAWSPGKCSVDRFDAKYSELVLGLEESDVTDGFYKLSEPYCLSEQIYPTVGVFHEGNYRWESLKPPQLLDGGFVTNIEKCREAFSRGVLQKGKGAFQLKHWKLAAEAKKAEIELLVLYHGLKGELPGYAISSAEAGKRIREIENEIHILNEETRRLFRKTMPEKVADSDAEIRMGFFDALLAGIR